jgi:hypothetical protein
MEVSGASPPARGRRRYFIVSKSRATSGCKTEAASDRCAALRREGGRARTSSWPISARHESAPAQSLRQVLSGRGMRALDDAQLAELKHLEGEA